VRATWLAAGLGATYALLTVLADRGAWLAYSWSTDAAKVWGLVGDGLVRPALRGLQTLDLLAAGDAFLAFVHLPRTLAADILQLLVGWPAHLAGLGADRYEAMRAMVAALGPAGSLWLWLGVSLLAGAGLGLAVLSAAAAGRRLLQGLARRRQGGGRPAE
jgi:hypothetical protein